MGSVSHCEITPVLGGQGGAGRAQPPWALQCGSPARLHRGEADGSASLAATADVVHGALDGLVFELLILPPFWRIVRVLRGRGFAGRLRAVRSRRRGAAGRAWPRPRLVGREQFGLLYGGRGERRRRG